ncbi:MAG: type II-B CRISPR-associated RNA-guided endonuclease Cas9/Csx12 [Gammaproteobacteria bacterium]|nr:type II-B CRISPR-associated RNA-guided endonuclease Cas9/Csx12 [Gammaproteobacteria bacterium]
MNKSIISPIAIDLGAKNTGVYFAHYPAGSSLDEIEKDGKVYQLEKDSYTLLMANRTAARHQRRGYDRRQMAKRLFKLVWCEHFGLKWDEDVQQTVSFLLNRRGFSFLAEEYDADVLGQFPQESFDELPDNLKIRQNDSGDYDFAGALTEWGNEGEAKVKSLYESLNKEPKRVRARLFFVSQTNKLREYCLRRKEGDKIPDKKRANLSQLSRWILEEWIKEGVQGLPAIPAGNTVDLVEYLNNKSAETSEEILRGLPSEKDLRQKKSELKKSNWEFEPEKFQMDKANFGEPGNPDIRTHLHHLAFAIHKIHDELKSGGRHRSKYFEEVKNVLERKNHTHEYLKRFCGDLQSGRFHGLTVDGLSSLIGHISNLELKPLRKYFNGKKHKERDYWDEGCLARLFDRWILREWRVGEKDKDKTDGGKWSYLELKDRWNGRGGSIVDFWLEIPSEYTIPPYQDNNNRRPPKCQSLLLNVGFLNHKYADWREWLSELKGIESVRNYLGDYEGQLKNLESGKSTDSQRRYYFSDQQTGKLLTDSGRRSMAELDARVLQFIFDRVKAEDGLNLNEIYSHAKKIKQDKHKQDNQSVKAVEQARGKLEESVRNSGLPQELKIDPDYGRDDLFPEGSFFHLICKYYKLRQRARDGRIFIHPEYRYIKGRAYENTGRFNDKNHLLTYCNQKPRQKRYQMLGDLAGVLQVSPHIMEQVASKHVGETMDDRLFDWLCDVNGLRANCDRAAKEQKERRGRLKLDIQTVFGLIGHRKQTESPSKREVKEILKSSAINGAQALYDFCERAKRLCSALTESLYNDSKQQEWQQELDKNPATAVYLLARIYSISFKERSGNANTCAVCSMDNAHRMQMVSANEGKYATAKAQRLPAIPTRLIDGAVMRMARIVGGAIARDKWEKIETELAADKRVCVPIITESNQFEFEPSKEELVKSQRTKPRKGRALERGGELKIVASKDERIRAAGKGMCPYTGESIPQGEGDKDHIIPRSSGYGTLNDEANIIWASDRGNKEVKKDREFSLPNLNGEYKRVVFDGKDDTQIKNWIIEQIGDGSSEDFKFGKYRSFINLAPEQQTAFRHALFLMGEPLREKVINAIDNKNRAFVNGTQRYFAEVLASEIYKLAKAKRKEGLLSFDYFGVEARPNSTGDSIYDLRKMYEADDEQIAEYAKSKDTRQQAYSHLIDAQLAFVIIADAHQREGGLKLQIDDKVEKVPYYDKETGEIYDGMLKYVRVSANDFELKPLSRQKPNENFSSHRAFTRDTYYADHYLPVLLKSESNVVTVRIGFDWQNSAQIKADSDRKNKKLLRDLVALLSVCEGTQMLTDGQYGNLDDLFDAMKGVKKFSEQLRKNGYCCLAVDKQKLHEFWMEKYNTKTGVDFNRDDFSYKNLQYRTERVTISKPEDLFARLKEAGKNFTKTIERQNITLPVKKDWERCLNTWQENEVRGVPFNQFLREYFKRQKKSPHQKVRKVFSLPVLTGQGKLMVRRKSWNGGYTYQVVNDSDSRGPDNKPNVSVRLNDGSLGIRLAKWAQSNNIVKFPSNEKYQDGEIINSADWYAVDKSHHTFPDGIEQIWYRIDDSTAPSIAVKLAKNGNQLQPECLEDPICQHGFRRVNTRKATKEAPEQPEKSPQDVRNEFFEKEIKPARQGEIICYKGKVYNAAIKEAFRTAIVSKLQ